jgi:hypothetical protein
MMTKLAAFVVLTASTTLSANQAWADFTRPPVNTLPSPEIDGTGATAAVALILSIVALLFARSKR